ncbi:MAG: HupE/UreJ family protein [Paracoccaceae bacterium]
MLRYAVFAATALAALPALAHHPLGGAPMTTLQDGLLSGVGHPILGFDHLFFILALGIAAQAAGRALSGPLAFLGAMAVGVIFVANGFQPPLVEPLIAVSLLLLGLAMIRGRMLSTAPLLALFALAGLVHGAAFGDAIAGQEGGAGAPVLIGYLVGLIGVGWALAVASGAVAVRVGGGAPRIAGAAVAGVGMFLILEAVEGAAFAAAGLG